MFYSRRTYMGLIEKCDYCQCLFISDGNPDIIEEAIYYFKANVFFKSYEIKVFKYGGMFNQSGF